MLFFIICLGSSFTTVDVSVKQTTHSSTVHTASTFIANPIKKATVRYKAKGQKPRWKRSSAGLVVLVIIGALLVTGLVGFGLYIMAWGGLSEVMIAIAAVIGLGLIVWGTVSIIKNINSKIDWVRNKLRFKNKEAITKSKEIPKPYSL